MSKAWGHNVRPMTDEEIQYQIRCGERRYQYQIGHPKEGITPDRAKSVHYERKCRISGKCQNECTHMLTYRYVTGRAGRTTFAEKPVCEVHAAKYQQV